MPISEKELSQARVSWGEGLVEISKANEAVGIEKASQLASEMLDSLYGFHIGPVLFKPTLSGGSQTFRTTKKGLCHILLGTTQNIHKTQVLESNTGVKFGQIRLQCALMKIWLCGWAGSLLWIKMAM